MSAASAYQEMWPGADSGVESILGADSDEVVLAKLHDLQVAILPAHLAGSDAAGRDWEKICKLKSDLQEKKIPVEATIAQAATEEAAPIPELQPDASSLRVSQPERDADDAAQEEDDAECGPAGQAEASSIDAPPQPKARARKRPRNEVEDDGGNASGERPVR